MRKTIAVLILWRDSSDYIERSLKQLESLENDFDKNFKFIFSFFENDSKDNTPQVLRAWMDKKEGCLITEKLHARKWNSVSSIKRTKLLASYRNRCLNYIKDIEYDYLFVVDSDIHYNTDLLKGMIETLEKNLTIGMITPNTVQNVQDVFRLSQSKSYFDSWALIDKGGNNGLTYASNPFLDSEDRERWDNNQMVYVNSAFGGAALIRGSLFRKNKLFWNGDLGCEHWNLCMQIKKLGYLIGVDPLLKANIIHKRTIKPDQILIWHDKARLNNQNCKSSKNTTLISRLISEILLFLLTLVLKLKRILAKYIKNY